MDRKIPQNNASNFDAEPLRSKEPVRKPQKTLKASLTVTDSKGSLTQRVHIHYHYGNRSPKP